jgi:hypothetical protein
MQYMYPIFWYEKNEMRYLLQKTKLQWKLPELDMPIQESAFIPATSQLRQWALRKFRHRFNRVM